MVSRLLHRSRTIDTWIGGADIGKAVEKMKLAFACFTVAQGGSHHAHSAAFPDTTLDQRTWNAMLCNPSNLVRKAHQAWAWQHRIAPDEADVLLSGRRISINRLHFTCYLIASATGQFL
ncbi:hypothetical protein A3736_02930 [Erythrobacter sp. HI0063]|nr:hypothetical protein A3736_02930 [Erythrobacter sp. HI0063]